MKIKIDYLGRVEGEAGVEFEIRGGKLRRLRINIWEPPRFFEGMLVGRSFDEVPDIVARICGICPVSHMVTSIRAIEKAIGFEPDENVLLARKIMSYSQIASSHLVHLVMLALPDYYGRSSFMELLPGEEALLKKFIRLKDVFNGITAAFGGGRALHPVSMVVGGFTALPDEGRIRGLRSGLPAAGEDMMDVFKTVSALELPDLKTDSELVALSEEGGYAVNKGRISSDMGLDGEEEDYERLFHEKEVPYSNAKKTAVRGRGALMVGALSRVSLHPDRLSESARKLALESGLAGKNKNPFYNIRAQAVEIVHFTEECRALLDKVQSGTALPKLRPKEGEGAALTEAPRGLLYHRYAVDRRGVVRKADIVTPTAHNYLGIEENLRRLIENNIDKPAERIRLLAEALIRAYDPCFSCSVH
ncbi:MAG: nickel-dependent hydrogenase large subunit [Nitrospiraceae bacterium]|nr:nickel-dependent hydrogenase large subunit [Nitrospiraceae bacterium]